MDTLRENTSVLKKYQPTVKYFLNLLKKSSTKPEPIRLYRVLKPLDETVLCKLFHFFFEEKFQTCAALKLYEKSLYIQHEYDRVGMV